jgi:dienelactone hydrolase
MGARFLLRLAAAALAALALAACATQPKNQVYVGVGTEMPRLALARDYAALYAPYAMMATLAYTDPAGLDHAQHCPSYQNLGHGPPGEDQRAAEFRTTARHWIKDLKHLGWECRFGVYGNLNCPKRLGDNCDPVSGLEFHIWRRVTKRGCEAVIAFRGTDKDDLGDWISNFRWLYRLAPKFDQYAQIKAHITRITQHIKKHGCGAATQIVSVGHSLGGGLAQQAAYADAHNSIHYVFAFDPSPVTGFFDVSAVLREYSTRGLGVDRAYEAGEILALPRIVIENIFPPAACHPRIRTVRFNVLAGLPVTQHNMEQLTKELRVAAAKPGADPRRVDDSLKARTCTQEPLVVPPA